MFWIIARNVQKKVLNFLKCSEDTHMFQQNKRFLAKIEILLGTKQMFQ